MEPDKTDDERATMERERFEMLMAAFRECAERGLSLESLETLARETGVGTKYLLRNNE